MKCLSFLFGFVIISQIASCQSPIQNPNNLDNQILWTTTLSPNLLNGKFPKILYKDIIVSQSWKDGRYALTAVHKQTGKYIWHWNDTFTGHEMTTEDSHVYNNILVWRHINLVYGINLDNGATIWKERIQGSGFGSDFLSGLGERFIFNTWNSTYYTGFTSRGEIQSSVRLVRNEYTDHAATTIFLNAPPNVVPGASLNDTLVVLPYNTYTHLYFTVYNLTQSKEVFTAKTDTNSGVFILAPMLHNGKLYFPSGRFILCFDLASGKELWREQFPSIFSLSGIIYHDGMIIGNCEDTFMYALDAKTGKQLWATKTSGTSSRLFEMNGVIYFTGGGDGLLHAVDAKTGKHIWKKESPDLQRNSGAWFFDSVTGADGKIYVSSYLSLFCYKAAR